MNAITFNGTPAPTAPAVADVQPTATTEASAPAARPFNFSVMMAEYYIAMQQLRRSVKEAESQGLLSQWHLQKSSLDRQSDAIDKTFRAAIANGVCEMFSGVVAGGAGFGGYKFIGGPMGLESGVQLGNGVFSPVLNNIGRIAGGAMTQEASDAQMRADFAKSCSEAHGHLISTLGEDGAAIRQEYLSALRTMSQMQMDILKSIDICR